MIAATASVCTGAFFFRTEFRSRLWARQVISTQSLDERAAALTRLCNAGDAGRWGVETLLKHPDAQIRQFGAVVLQHVRSEWSRGRLVELLEDPSDAVAELAVLGLAIHGDGSVIPRLATLYVEGDDAAAAAACAALERLGAAESRITLAKLAGAPAAPNRRAALIDALASAGGVDCAAALLGLLDDGRPCDVPTREERLVARFTPQVAARGFAATPASQPAATHAAATVAERAAAALADLTGLNPPFASDLPSEQRLDAIAIWHDWIAARREAP